MTNQEIGTATTDHSGVFLPRPTQGIYHWAYPLPVMFYAGWDGLSCESPLRITSDPDFCNEVSYSPVQPWHKDPVQDVLDAVRAYHKAFPRTGFKQCAWVWGKLSQYLDYIILPDSAEFYHGQILTPEEFKSITGLDIPADFSWRYVVECD